MYQHSNVLSSSKTTSVFIPCGPKFMATFKEENNKPLCILYDIERKIHKHIYVAFDPILTLGTQLYGTLIDHVFIVEKIMLYKNKPLQHKHKDIYKKIEHLLDHYINVSNVSGVYNFKLPFMSNEEPIFSASELSYNVYGILQFTPNAKLYKLSNSYCHFIISKHRELSEVYCLYVMNDNEVYYYGNAYVNDIKTNYLLRKIFKHKKNYKNIEYSDDESDTIVEYEEDTYYVTCIYLPVYKKWKPYTFNNRKRVDTLKKNTSFYS